MRGMRHVYLLRHAKSSGKQRGLSDHDRPLTRRGRGAATAIARHLREQGIGPELVLCSTARRARETLERIEPVLARRTAQEESELYGASAGALLERLRLVPDAVGSVRLIGHNPGLQQLALVLPTDARMRELEAKYPTAALAILAFDRPNWSELDQVRRSS
jgi:phosphohistidine phosphatase